MLDGDGARVTDRLTHAADLARRDTGDIEQFDPLSRAPAGEEGAELGHELVAMLDAPVVRAVALVFRELRPLEYRAEPCEEPVVRRGDGHLAVRGRERLVRDDARVCVA